MHHNSSVKLLGRMALVALVIGTSVTVSATERVTAGLVLAGILGWSFVPALQLLTGLLLVRGARPPVRLLDRYFAMHWPWSLWILSAQATLLMVPIVRSAGWWVAITTVVPILWTVRLLFAFCRRELGLERLHAWRRVLVHQTATYLLVLAYVTFAVALWPRLMRLLS